MQTLVAKVRVQCNCLSVIYLECRGSNCLNRFIYTMYVVFELSFAISLMGKRELVDLLSLSCWCRMVVVWLFLAAMGLSAVCDCGIS